MAKTITIIQNDSGDLKALLKELRDTSDNGNPYYGRSESSIARMILQPALAEEHRKYCGRGAKRRADGTRASE